MKAWQWLCWSVALCAAGCGVDDGHATTPGAAGAAAMPGAGGSSGSRSGSGGTAGGTTGGGAAVVRPSPALPDGQVVAPWDKFCIATFTESYDVRGSFNELVVSVKPGARYLLAEADFSSVMKIFYLADAGPIEFAIKVDDAGALPFMPSCKAGTTQSYIAVFADTPVYSDEARTMTLCTLPAGLAVPGMGINYVASGSEAYSVELKQLAAYCGKVSKGFVKGTRVTIGTSTHFDIAIATIQGPPTP